MMPTPPSIIDFTAHPRIKTILAEAEKRPGCQGFTELLGAVANGRIGLVCLFDRKAIWSPRSLKSSLPTVLWIGDDFGASRDPAEWRSAIGAIAWARSAVIHGCGGEPWHYQHAVMAAEVTGRCLFVETDSDHVAAWRAAIEPREIPGLTIIPRPGQRHPIEQPRQTGATA